MEEVQIPDKLYFKIGEVSRIVGVPAYVLRFWENEFRVIHPKRTESGQRLYRQKDVGLILTIKRLLYEEKFTIEGAKKFLQDISGKSSPEQEKLEQVREELLQIRQLLS